MLLPLFIYPSVSVMESTTSDLVSVSAFVLETILIFLFIDL